MTRYLQKTLIIHGPIYISITKDFGSNWEMANIDNPGVGVMPQITTNSSGQYVYAIWDNDFDFGPIQAVISHDSGKTFKVPNIGNLISVGNYPQITTNNSGQYVYAIWQSSKTGGLIQAAISHDKGNSWKRLTLFKSQFGFFPKITTDGTGKFVMLFGKMFF